MRNNNNNNNNSWGSSSSYGGRDHWDTNDDVSDANQMRPLSGSSAQREGDSSLKERRTSFNDIDRKEVSGSGGGGEGRPRPLSTSSLVRKQENQHSYHRAS